MKSEPYKIALINMPFASLSMPSLALTQIAEVLDQEFGDKVSVGVHYLSFDFVEYMGGLDLYNHANLGAGFMTGIGEWFFRQCAFPAAEDNADAYFDRFYHTDDEETTAVRAAFSSKRETLADFLDQLIDRYQLDQCDMVGFTTLFSQTVASFAMAQRLKMRNPKIVTVVGGAACDGVMGMEFAEHVMQMDYVFSGPALVSFPGFVRDQMEGNLEACEAVNGLFTKNNQDRWPRGCDAVPEEKPLNLLGDDQDINQEIPLDYTGFLDKMDETFPTNGIRPVLLFETSRGCWWAEKAVCSFCGLNGMQMKHRNMSAESARKHIESLYQWMPRCETYMAVDTILPKGYTDDVFPRLSPPDNMKMFYELKVDVTEPEIKILSDKGVVAFQPGIEALSTSTLKLMRKGTSAFRNVQFLKNCSQHPVSLDWNLLIYSPGESERTYEKYQRDIPLMMHLAPPSGVYPIGFVRFSRYFNDPEEFNLDLKPQDFYGMTYPFDGESVFNLAYHFVDRNADTKRMDYWLERLNTDVQRWRTRWLGEDGMPQARLCLVGEGDDWSVYDSRSGIEEETPVSAITRKMLEAMADTPRDALFLEKSMADVSGANVEQEVALILDKGWAFEENGRMLNLVGV